MITEQKKREIEILLAEYKQAVEDYRVWYGGWKERNSGLRCLREKRGTHEQTPETESSGYHTSDD